MLNLSSIKFDSSPNCGTRGGKTPEIIVLHCPVGTLAGTVATFKNPRTQVSAHYVVDRDGSILQMVALENAAWHAMHYPNLIGIGIEMVDMYMYSGYMSRGCMADPQWFTKLELDATAELVAALMTKFKIPINKVMGHNDPWLVQFGNNHKDPGMYFPWVSFRANVSQRLTEPQAKPANKSMNDVVLEELVKQQSEVATASIEQAARDHFIPTKLDIPLRMKTRKKRGKPLRKVTRKKN